MVNFDSRKPRRSGARQICSQPGAAVGIRVALRRPGLRGLESRDSATFTAIAPPVNTMPICVTRDADIGLLSGVISTMFIFERTQVCGASRTAEFVALARLSG